MNSGDDNNTGTTGPTVMTPDEITDEDFLVPPTTVPTTNSSPFANAGDDGDNDLLLQEQNIGSFVDSSEDGGAESVFLSEGGSDPHMHQPDDKKHQEQRLDAKETRLVNRSKLLVYLIILLSAAVCGGLTYWFVQSEEERFYEDEFEDLAVDIFDYIEVNLNKLQESAHAVAGSWTSRGTFPEEGADEFYAEVYAKAQEEEEEEDDEEMTNSTETDAANFTEPIADGNSTETEEDDQLSEFWTARLSPNMTYPNFGMVVGNLAALSKAEIMYVAPLVKEEDVEGWQAYAVQHQGWIEQDIILNQLLGGGSSSDDSGDGESGDGESGEEDDENDEDEEDDEDEDDEEDGEDSDSDDEESRYRVKNPGSIRTSLFNSVPGGYNNLHVPIWQLFPTPQIAEEAPIMMDFMGFPWFRELFDRMLETKASQLSPPLVEDANDLIRYQEDDPPWDEGWLEPKSLLVEPIFDRLEEEDREIAGVSVAVIEWTDYLDEDFGDKAEGLIVELEYQCREDGNTLSSLRYAFTKDGRDNGFLGTNYEPDSRYSHMTQRYRLEVATGRRERTGGEDEDEDDEDDEEEADGDGEDDEV